MADLRQVTFDANVFTIPVGVVTDNALSDTSENPVQNKVITAALADKVDAEAGKGLSENDLTHDLKAQYDGYEDRIATAEAALDVLNADDTTDGSVAKAIKDAIATVVDNAPAAFDTLKEVADWIENDTTGAAAMAAKIATLETKVATLESLLENYSEIVLSMTDGTDTVNKMILAKEATV